ncbi:hypothetical protein, partial [Frankia sp. R82]|uniref:hypothetical protein n=1 Tax=Frankia sp. R82 TaxID=2950553 RepID=UPI0020445FDD
GRSTRPGSGRPSAQTDIGDDRTLPDCEPKVAKELLSVFVFVLVLERRGALGRADILATPS